MRREGISVICWWRSRLSFRLARVLIFGEVEKAGKECLPWLGTLDCTWACSVGGGKPLGMVTPCTHLYSNAYHIVLLLYPSPCQTAFLLICSFIHSRNNCQSICCVPESWEAKHTVLSLWPLHTCRRSDLMCHDVTHL